jgi:hypothetical protein
MNGGSAANDDRLGEALAVSAAPADIGIDTVIEPGIEATGGWDAYDVWRRFIKEARDRRKHPDSN